MCYDITYLTKRQTDYAARYGTQADVEDLQNRLPATWHVNAFNFSLVPVVAGENRKFQAFQWGLIPFWVKTTKDAMEIRRNTLNARSESMFEKPSFRKAASRGRCLVIVDGFFESHHANGTSYPYFIQRIDQKPFALGGIYDEWANPEDGEVITTVSIVTVEANSRMAQIHNNPKVLERGGPRMPLILNFEDEDSWLDPSLDKKALEKVMTPFPENLLTDHTVRPLKGKASPGNTSLAVEPFDYPELGAKQITLF